MEDEGKGEGRGEGKCGVKGGGVCVCVCVCVCMCVCALMPRAGLCAGNGSALLFVHSKEKSIQIAVFFLEQAAGNRAGKCAEKRTENRAGKKSVKK